MKNLILALLGLSLVLTGAQAKDEAKKEKKMTSYVVSMTGVT